MAILGVRGRWLRHKTDGTIYNYNEVLCKNPAVEEVPEEIAFPEKFIPEKQKGRKTTFKLSTDAKTLDKTKRPKKTKPELAADAAKGLRK